MKQVIRLTESDLHRLVKESVRRILAETDASSSGDVNRPVFPMMRRPSPVGEPTDEEIKPVDTSDAIDRSDRKKHSVAVNYVKESIENVLNYPVYDTTKRKEIAARDRDRIEQLAHDKEYKNHPNRQMFSTGRLFGSLSSYLEEAAFQLLGFERFDIQGVWDNPWDNIYHMLKWAIENKGLNASYLNRLSDSDFTRKVTEGDERLFSSEELREISSVLPYKLKEELYRNMVNISRISTVNDTVNHILVMNDGDNAEKFMNIVRMRLSQLKANGSKFNRNMMHSIVKDALQKINLLPSK
jgi:hypothetical protein